MAYSHGSLVDNMFLTVVCAESVPPLCNKHWHRLQNIYNTDYKIVTKTILPETFLLPQCHVFHTV